MPILVSPTKMNASDPKRIGGVWSFISRFNALIDWIVSLSPAGSTQYDTDWVNVTLNPGFSAQGSQPFQVRRSGKKVDMRWGISNAGLTANTTSTVGVVPAGFRPTINAYATPITQRGDIVNGRITVEPNGNIILIPGTTLGSYYLAPNGFSWYVD